MSGLPWYKMDSQFSRHPKTRRLCTLLGDPNAGMYAVRLFEYCAEFAPTGEIPVELVEQAAGWGSRRTPGKLSLSLAQVGFIERKADRALLHGWDERNGAHVRKAKKDNARPNSTRRNPDETPQEPRAGFALESREEKRENKRNIATKKLVAPATTPFATLQARLVATFHEVTDSDYLWQGAKDAQALKRLLALGADHTTIDEKWRSGLAGQGWKSARTIAQLAAKWNDLEVNPDEARWRRAREAAERELAESAAGAGRSDQGHGAGDTDPDPDATARAAVSAEIGNLLGVGR